MRANSEAVFLFLAVAAGVAVASSLAIEVPEPEWHFEVLDNDTVSFTEVEVGDRVHVVARTEQGLEHFTKPKPLLRPDTKLQFRNQFIAEGGSNGNYASLEMISGTPMVGFQYEQINGERVRLAEWNGTAWEVSTVPGERGLNVGMGTELASLQGDPVLFYTGNGERNLRIARRLDSNWTKRYLEPDTGVFTDAEKCGDSVRVVYSSRDNYEASLGRLSEGSWNSRRLNTTATSLDLATNKDCQTFVAAHSGRENEVFIWNGSKHRIDTSVFSRTSAEFGNGNPYTLYGKDGSGVYVGNGRNQSTIYRAAGEHNDLEVQNGNRYVAFTNESKLVYGEYNTLVPERAETVLLAARSVLSLVALLALLVALWRSPRFRERLDSVVSKI